MPLTIHRHQEICKMADDTDTITNTDEIQEITDKEAEWEGASALLGACWRDVAHNERCGL